MMAYFFSKVSLWQLSFLHGSYFAIDTEQELVVQNRT